MPQKRVKITYTKAGSSPSERRREDYIHPSHVPEMKVPKGLSPLAQYLKDNEDSGLSSSELIEQFQEYDCTHAEKTKVATGTKVISTCLACGLVEVM